MAVDDQSVPDSMITQAVQARLGTVMVRAIHVFLAILAIVILLAAVFAVVDTVTRDFPGFFEEQNQYNVLQQVISNILLIAIAAELGLLLLLHRTTAAIEVIILVVARKIVSPETTALEILMGVAALCILIITRSYFLPNRRTSLP